jgi:hypothetical protein
MALLSSGLETIDYGVSQWQALITRAMELLNGEVLSLNEIIGVDPTTIEDGSVLTWDATAGNYVWKKY